MVLSRAKRFGSSSEKTPQGQLALEFFDEAEKESNLNAVEPTAQKTFKKKRKSRTENISNLETEVVEHTLSDSDAICPNCNTALKKMSEESRETIKLYKKVIRSIEKRAIYSCPKCSLVVKASMPKLPIEGSLATSSTLAQVIVDKYANGLPLYRQSQDYSRIGLNLSRQTLSNWMM
ncbi:MAG: transposase [Tenericutes bacterium]|nr:transposase [Mycoplasmatota bacterium]